jgi:uncharacterized protein YecE (DUF72 family)
VASAIHLGTCSWADRGLVETWYPKDRTSAESRLRYYAERFDAVEVNASYYAIPEPETAQRWADRTPPGFVFHVKAFGLMTGHRVRPEQLPPDLRPRVASVTARGNVEPDAGLRRAVFERFEAALAPLRDASKLGGVLMQYPPSFAPTGDWRARIAADRELLGGTEMLVEFRQRDWLAEPLREEVLGFLEAEGLTYVSVDAPTVASPNAVESVVAATSATGYVRFHGRNAATWNVQGREASERFDHYYSEDELAVWVEPLRGLGAATDRTYAFFNTNNADQGPVNADLLRHLLEDAHVPVAPAPGPAQDTLF